MAGTSWERTATAAAAARRARIRRRGQSLRAAGRAGAIVLVLGMLPMLMGAKSVSGPLSLPTAGLGDGEQHA